MKLTTNNSITQLIKLIKTALKGKADVSHNHTKSQITDMPTKLSQFTNDVGFKTTDNNTTYTAGRMLQLSNNQFNLINTCQGITDWNQATSTGWYMAQNASNSPKGELWYFGYVISHNSNYVFQEVYEFTASSNATSIPKYIRARTAGVWGQWSLVTVQKAVPADAKFTDTIYTHPSSHPATMITQDSTHRFVTDTEKSNWNGKAAGNHNHDGRYVTPAGMKSTAKTITIQPSNWSSGIYQLNDSLITTSTNQEILPPIATGSNDAMLKAIQKANIQDGGQGSGWLKLKCLGTVPTVAIELRVIFRGDK